MRKRLLEITDKLNKIEPPKQVIILEQEAGDYYYYDAEKIPENVIKPEQFSKWQDENNVILIVIEYDETLPLQETQEMIE